MGVKEGGSKGRWCVCYAQVAKSPKDHQGADIQCKSKRVFITKLELGLSPSPTQRLWGGAPSSGLQCLYRVLLQEKFEKREFPGWEMSNWLPSVEGLGVGFWLVPISRAGHRFWLVRRWWGGVKGFRRSCFPGNFYKMESSLTKRGGLGSSCVWLIWIVCKNQHNIVIFLQLKNK